MNIIKVTVIGSGIMGNGIAQVFASSGYQVILNDVSPDMLDGAKKNIKNSLKRLIKKEKLSEKESEEIFAKLSFTKDLETAITGADYIIEAITENIEMKLKLFEKIDRLSPPHTIIGSNTSQYSITKLANATNRASQVIGTHFFNPPVIMKLVEIVKGVQTSDGTINTTLKLVKSIRKEAVVCSDSPGFITSRLINLFCNEAEKIVEEGIASSEDVDKACRLAFNHPMGPLELSDFSGLDTRLMASKGLEEGIGERFKPTRTLRNYVNAGQLGRKSGKGFYSYEK